jgi:Protein of unknown function (DUF3617)
MRNKFVRLRGVAITLAAVGVAPIAQSAEKELSRKPGLWEVRTTIENSSAPARVVKQCIDAATDGLSQSIAGPFSPAVCPERKVQRSADAITVDSTCSIAGKPASAHAVVTGSFDSAYTMKVVAEGDLLPGGKMTMTMEGKWLGACTANQRPGDIIMGNGVTINIPDMQKRAPSTIDQMAPH